MADKYVNLSDIIETLEHEWGYEGMREDLEKLPTADVVEVRHGKWEKSEIPEEKYVCSVCGGACWYYDYQGELAKSRFCPNCGAKMDGERKEGEE